MTNHTNTLFILFDPMSWKTRQSTCSWKRDIFIIKKISIEFSQQSNKLYVPVFYFAPCRTLHSLFNETAARASYKMVYLMHSCKESTRQMKYFRWFLRSNERKRITRPRIYEFGVHALNALKLIRLDLSERVNRWSETCKQLADYSNR